MMPEGGLARHVILAVTVAAVSCGDQSVQSGRGDAASDGRSSATGGSDAGDTLEAAVDAGGEADVGYDGPASGPMTLVGRRMEILEERLCDLDGDGLGDNAVADLGPMLARVFIVGLGTMFSSAVEERIRLLMHFPWIDDLATPATSDGLSILCMGQDTDEPRDVTDDFSGCEPFYVNGEFVDACGEPLYFFPEAVIDGGEVTTEAGTIVMPLGEVTMRVHGARATGTLLPGGEGGTLTMCGYSTIADLGVAPGLDGSAEPSMLAALVTGGALFGIPDFPGLDPNVDVDGDGLESVEVDGDGNVIRCCDGDSTAIEGADCFADPRLADGFGLAARLEAVSAVLAGLEPNWQRWVEGTCEEQPAEGESLWGP